MPILPWTHPVAEIPAGSRTYTREANLAECSALAAELGLLACSACRAQYTLRGLSGGRYKLAGALTATVTQACVITGDPVESKLDLPVEVEFSPNPEGPAPEAGENGDVEISSLPEVEPIENGTLDVGRVMFESLAAGLDPYPKKTGAEFSWHDETAKDEKNNPFAVLANFKPKAGG